MVQAENEKAKLYKDNQNNKGVRAEWSRLNNYNYQFLINNCFKFYNLF